MTKLKELETLSLVATYEVDDSFDSEKFIKLRLRVQHDGKNPNQSYFELEDIENARDSIKNIPILANVVFDENDEPQFGGHDMKIEKSKVDENDYKLIYLETPIGLVPEDNNYEIAEHDGRNYVYVDAYCWRGYSNYAEDIIERDNLIKLSMEILIDKYEYNAKEKYYKIIDYKYQGITFLNKDYGTGMIDAKATTNETFSEKTETEQLNKEDFKEKFVLMMEELKEALSNYNIKNNNKEGGNFVDEQVKELLNKFNLTIEELTFDIADMSLEEIEVKLNELTETDEVVEDIDETDKETNNIDESTEDFEKSEEVAEEITDEINDEEISEEEAVEEEVQEPTEETEVFVKSFELSHDDIRYALYQLLYPVEDEDGEWYFIDQVYDDRFEYLNWEGTKVYRQVYKTEGDVVSFDGDRIKLYQERLTEEEKQELDAMRNNYSILEQEVEDLRSFKEEKITKERKEAESDLFSQFDEQLKDNESYSKLKKDASNFTLDQLEKEIAFILVKDNGNFKFTSKSSPTRKEKVKIQFTKKDEVKIDEYDDLFGKYLKEE